VSGVYQVPFKFGSRTEFGFSDSTKQSIRDHLKWFNSEAGKCIVFKEENSEDFEGSRLKIVGAQSGCWSFIGKTHKEQLIRNGDGNIYNKMHLNSKFFFKKHVKKDLIFFNPIF